MIERDDRHQVLTLGQFHAVAFGKFRFGHLQSRAAKKQRLAGTGHAGLVVIKHQDVVQIISGKRLAFFSEHWRT